MNRFRCIAWLLAMLPALAGAQNMLVNGGFDADLSGWDFPDATPVWTSFDIADAPDSGSALATNAATTPDSTVVVLRQCLPITKAGLYTLRASVFVPTGQVDGEAIASYGYGMSADCSTGFFGLGGFFMPSMGVWKTYDSGTKINVPSDLPVISMFIQVRLDKTPDAGVFEAYFDNVSLIYDGIFDDGFESPQP